MNSRSFAFLALGLALAVLIVPDAMAGTDTVFQTVWTTLETFSKGYLGRIISVLFVIVGLGAGVARGSLLGLVTGVAAGVGLFYAPDLISNIVTATL